MARILRGVTHVPSGEFTVMILGLPGQAEHLCCRGFEVLEGIGLGVRSLGFRVWWAGGGKSGRRIATTRKSESVC